MFNKHLVGIVLCFISAFACAADVSINGDIINMSHAWVNVNYNTPGDHKDDAFRVLEDQAK